jgi:uncharacterized membrane protein YfcA
MSWWELLLIPLGFAVGAYGTLVGAGGGFVLVPALLVIYPDEDPASITSISLAVVFFNALSGTVAYARQHRIDYRSGLLFAAAGMPGAIAGAFLVDAVPRRLFDALFGAVLLSLAAYTLFSVGRPQQIRAPLRGRGIIRRVMPGAEPGETFRYSYRAWQGLLMMAGIGFLSSLLGIGGGVISVPMMITVLRFPVHVAVATSQFILAFMAGEGSAVHLANGDLHGENVLRALLVAVGAIPGAQVGAILSRRLRGPVVARLLVIALVVVGARLLFAAGLG